MKYIIYNNITGKIASYGTASVLMSEDVGFGEAIMVGEGTDLVNYVNLSGAPTIIDRPTNGAVLALGDDIIAADGIEEANISVIPTGSTYQIIGPVSSFGSIIGTTLSFTTDTPGGYTIEIQSFPELDTTFTVTAT